MKLIFAQGNPESRYDNTRHNVGFLVVEAFADTQKINWAEKSKFHALIAEVIIDGEKVILTKPTTYYNDTGLSARAIIDFYKLNPATDLLVIHDDLALPFGTIRTRQKGSDAGNNGIKSLNAALNPDYSRIRIGIWNELRDRMDDAEFVLGRFSKAESEQLEKTITPHVITLVNDFIQGNLKDTSHKPE